MTFGGFNRECQLFECSKEYFDLFKEASELDLMSLFIKQQIYIAENTDAALIVGDGYLTESVGDELSSMEDAFFEKSEKFVSRIRKSVAAICKTIAKFFRTLAAKIKKLFDDTPINQAELKQSDPATLEQKVTKVGHVIVGLTVPTLVGILAVDHIASRRVPKYIKDAVNASAKELKLNESETAVLMNIANAARNGDEFAMANIKSDKKILGVDQVSKLKDMLDYAVQWIERREGVSIKKINFEPILAGGNGISKSIVIANNPKMYEKIADDFESIHQSIVKIEEFNVRKQYHKRESNNPYHVPDHYVNINDDRDVIIGMYNVNRMERDHKALLNSVATLHEWIAETQKFYAEWDKLLTVAHMSFFERRNVKKGKGGKISSKGANITSNDRDLLNLICDIVDVSEKSEVKKK